MEFYGETPKYVIQNNRITFVKRYFLRKWVNKYIFHLIIDFIPPEKKILTTPAPS